MDIPNTNQSNDESGTNCNSAPRALPSKRLCKNCNMPGHIHRNCGFPITSIGIIVCRDVDTPDISMLMVRRKDTYGYVDFLRGKLNFKTPESMQSAIDEMTLREKDVVCNIKSAEDIRELRKQMWGDFKIQFRKEENDACINIMAFINNNPGMLSRMVLRSNTEWGEPEWGFPKGKRDHHETDIRCANREFEEETGISKQSIHVLQNVKPVEETYIGTDDRPYKHKYFIALMTDSNAKKTVLTEFQRSEISKVMWVGERQLDDIMRPDNQKKRDVYTQACEIFKKYKVIC